MPWREPTSMLACLVCSTVVLTPLLCSTEFNYSYRRCCSPVPWLGCLHWCPVYVPALQHQPFQLPWVPLAVKFSTIKAEEEGNSLTRRQPKRWAGHLRNLQFLFSGCGNFCAIERYSIHTKDTRLLGMFSRRWSR